MNDEAAENSYLEWRIHRGDATAALPTRLFAAHPRNAAAALPVEVAMLLPTQARNRHLPDHALPVSDPADSTLGLCLVDPFLRLDIVADRMQRHGIGWVSNFPSVAQHDPAFLSFLSDVESGFSDELARLKEMQDRGLRTLAILCHARDVPAAVQSGPDCIAYLPNVASFVAGFPSPAERNAQQSAIATALQGAGWSGPFLRYALPEETPHQTGPALVRPVMS